MRSTNPDVMLAIRDDILVRIVVCPPGLNDSRAGDEYCECPLVTHVGHRPQSAAWPSRDLPSWHPCLIANYYRRYGLFFFPFLRGSKKLGTAEIQPGNPVLFEGKARAVRKDMQRCPLLPFFILNNKGWSNIAHHRHANTGLPVLVKTTDPARFLCGVYGGPVVGLCFEYLNDRTRPLDFHAGSDHVL